MNGGYDNEFFTISDEDGNDYVLEHLDTIEVDDTFYLAFVPADMDEDDDDYGLVIFKAITENGEDLLASVDDDDLLESIFGRFLERLMEEDED